MISMLASVFPAISATVSHRVSSHPRKRSTLVALCAVLFFAGSCCPSKAQTAEWEWSGGNNTLLYNSASYDYVPRPGNYGTLGVPSAGNSPGGRTAASSWIDQSGNLWLFGGNGVDSTGTGGSLNDLWEFSPSTNEWTWIAGSSTVAGYLKPRPGVYGTLGVPAPGNTPGGREGAVSWTDHNGNFWLFGGYGTDSAGVVSSELNDLWQFSPVTNEWTWMGGVSTFAGTELYPGVYGTLGVPATGNLPGSRDAGASWTDSSGNLWLFGGYGIGASSVPGELSDLWEFNPSTLLWTWMGGSTVRDTLGVYGSLGVPSAGNNPGGRHSTVNWTDSSGNLWLFGGVGFDSVTPSVDGALNDLWEFNISSNEWTWMGGNSVVSSTGGYPGVYGSVDVPAATNIPGSRYYSVAWTDSVGNFWLFGGEGFDSTDFNAALNDLWEYTPSANVWIWQGGSTTSRNGNYNCTPICGRAGVYGTIDTSASANIPGSRLAATGWVDNSGNFWLFGGAGFDSGGFYSDLNDLWEYLTPPSIQPAATPAFSIAGGTYTTAQSVMISDATANATIYYTIDGTIPTTASTLYTGPITVSTNETLKAIATASGFSRSSVATVSYTILQTPVITWATPSPIIYGTALSTTQLNASSTVAGTFTYSPAAGTVLTAGAQALTVTFTPTDTTDYATATATVTLAVSQATPTITWPTPAAITYGTALSATQLDASSTVAGTFTYSPAAGTVLTAGAQALTVTFTPTDTTDYTTATATVTLTVNKATPAITWATPAAITYGTALSATQLNASSTVAGTFTYSPAAGAVLTAGAQALTVTFTPTDTTDYTTATATVTLTVNKATPTITWATPAAITYGTALSATQLNASSTVAGSFSYSPAAGTMLTAGAQALTVTFTPTDTTNYTAATATVTLTVNKATPPITWATPAAITYGTALSATQLNASSTVAGSFTYSPAAGTVPAVGTQTLTVTFTPTNTTDYTTATDRVTLTVNPAPTFTLSATPTSMTVAKGSSGTSTIKVSGQNGFTGSVTLTASGLPSGVTAAFATNPTIGSSVLTLKASTSAAVGTATVTIKGTSGSLTASTTVALTISCTPTTIVPYISVNGGSTWTEESSATVNSPSTAVDLGPQPISGGSWSWTGPNGYKSTSRQINSIPLTVGTDSYVATYTNASSCKSTETFTITVK